MATKYINATIKIQVELDDTKEISMDDVLVDMDYNFKTQTEGAEVVDTEWIDSEVEG